MQGNEGKYREMGNCGKISVGNCGIPWDFWGGQC